MNFDDLADYDLGEPRNAEGETVWEELRRINAPYRELRRALLDRGVTADELSATMEWNRKLRIRFVTYWLPAYIPLKKKA